MGLSLDLSWLCYFSVSCPTNRPPGWMLDLPCPYKPPWCCGFSAAGPIALLRYSGMGWGPQQPLGLWCWRSTSPHGTWMLEPEVPPASLAIDQSISVGREAAGKAKSAVLKLWDGAESGQGSPGRFFPAGQCCPVELSPPDHLFMHSLSPWRDVPFHMCHGDLQMHWGGLSQCHEPSLQTVYLTRTLLLGSSSLAHEVYQKAPAELAFWGAWGRRRLCHRKAVSQPVGLWQQQQLWKVIAVCLGFLYVCLKGFGGENQLLQTRCLWPCLCIITFLSPCSPFAQMLFVEPLTEPIPAESCLSTTEPLHPLRTTIRTLAKWATSISLQLPARAGAR